MENGTFPYKTVKIQYFLKNENFLEKLDYRLLVGSTSMENGTFSYKTVKIQC